MGFGIDVILRKEMEAREKLREALYFLEEIKKLEDQGRFHTFSEDEFRKRNLALRANLSAFILAWASIPDILLYDFAERFSLDISRKERTTGIDYFRHLTKALAKRNDEFQEPARLYDWLDQERRRLFEKHNRLASIRDVVTHRGIIRTERGEQVVEMDMPVNTTGVSAIVSGWYPGVTAGSIPGQVTEAGVRPLGPVKDDYAKELYAYGVMKPVVLAKEEQRKEKAESLTYLTGDPDKIPISDRCESAYTDVKKLIDEAWTRTSASV